MTARTIHPTPRRLLIVMPSWVGDSVMATPALRALRSALPGALIGALVRPGIDELLAGLPYIDQLHAERITGMMGPKRAAQRLRLHRYDAALLLTNSFSTALTARLASIPVRVGYDRDARGMLLTLRLTPPRRHDTPPYSASRTDPGAWAPVPAVRYYFSAARALLDACDAPRAAPPTPGPLELAITPDQRTAADDLLARAGLANEPFAVLNPGGNNPAKRWPPGRFARAADHLITKHNLRVALSGAPTESPLLAEVRAASAHTDRITDISALGASLGTLKGVIARAAIMLTNDTGPRHIAAALNIPLVTLFGPTDHRWTTIPFDREHILTADPTLPEAEVANDHPDRCAITRIDTDRVTQAIDERLQ